MLKAFIGKNQPSVLSQTAEGTKTKLQILREKFKRQKEGAKETQSLHDRVKAMQATAEAAKRQRQDSISSRSRTDSFSSTTSEVSPNDA